MTMGNGCIISRSAKQKLNMKSIPASDMKVILKIVQQGLLHAVPDSFSKTVNHDHGNDILTNSYFKNLTAGKE